MTAPHVRLGDSSDYFDRTLVTAQSKWGVDHLCFPPTESLGGGESYCPRITAAPAARSSGRARLFYVFRLVERRLCVPGPSEEAKLAAGPTAWDKVVAQPRPQRHSRIHVTPQALASAKLPCEGLGAPSLVSSWAQTVFLLAQNVKYIIGYTWAGPLRPLGWGGNTHRGVMHNGLTKNRQTARSSVVSKRRLLLHSYTSERAVSVSR